MNDDDRQLSEEEAKPCPFCGVQPWIQPWHGGAPTKRLIDCQNDMDCNAQPSVTGSTEAEALAHWNMRDVPRVERSPPPAGWIPVAAGMPKPDVPVIAFADNGKGWTRRIRAYWCPKGTIPHSGDDDNSDYDEAKDEYFTKEGWYERNEYEEINWMVNDPVTHWMPLPEPPGSASPERKQP